jgi:protocatechuate 3,4-dioxygenase beta subunit
MKFGFFFFTAILAAQTQPAATTLGLSSIEGTVTDAVTGAPLPEVRISTNRNLPPVKTDDQGHYALREIPSAFYQVLATKDGYAHKASLVRLPSGQAVKGIDLKLDREAAVAGHVLDRDGKPVLQARVAIRAQGYRDGRPVLGSFHSVTTDDSGGYRIAGLGAGRYFLEAEPRALTVRKRQPGDPLEDKPPAIADVRTYYNGSTGVEGASPLELSAGQQLEGLDITLLRRETVCVTSSLGGAAADPSQRFTVALSELMPMSQSRAASGTMSAGDEFEICGVPPGAYRIWAFTTSELRYASQTVTVGDRAVKAQPLLLAPAQSLTGTITVAGARPQDPVPAVQVALDEKDRIAIAGETLNARSDSTGAFTLPSVLSDEYWLRVSGLPAGYYVKEATINGRDALRDPLRTGQGDLRIVLGADGPTLSGAVLTADNQPVANAVVQLAVYPLPQTLGYGDVRTAFTDQNGAYTFPSLPPGSYRALAFRPVTDDVANNVELVRANLSSAADVTLAPKENKKLSLTPVP